MPSGVPVAFPPFNTSPSTSKETLPVARLTRALPPTVLQGVVPGLIPPTASLLETVILPTMSCQRTLLLSLSSPANAEAGRETDNTASNTAHAFFIFFILFYPFVVLNRLIPDVADRIVHVQRRDDALDAVPAHRVVAVEAERSRRRTEHEQQSQHLSHWSSPFCDPGLSDRVSDGFTVGRARRRGVT